MGIANLTQVLLRIIPFVASVLKKVSVSAMYKSESGARLKSLKKAWKGKVLSDGKELTGKGRLTNHVMNTLQNYYGLAIRQSKGNQYAMRRSIAALIHHCSENPCDEKRHLFCPKNADSWCKYQADKINRKKTYKQHISISSAV